MAVVHKVPPLLITSGEQGLRRRRFVAGVVAAKKKEGWSVSAVDGSDPGAVRDALEGDLFTTGNSLAVVSSPDKVNLELLEAHYASKKVLTTLLLHIEGEPDGRTKFGKAVKGPWAPVHKSFPLPTDWKAPEVAAEFVQEEVKAYGLTLESGLTAALVDRAGTDLGILAYEVSKIAILTKLDGVTVIETKHVRGGMAPIAEASALPISDALAMRQPKKLLKALTALRRTSRDDPTMRVSRLLASSVSKWMQALYLDALPPKAAAEELGVHPWFFENKILPAAKRWGKLNTVQLISDLAAAERAVLNGALDPWTVLISRLMAACSAAKDSTGGQPRIVSVLKPVVPEQSTSQISVEVVGQPKLLLEPFLSEDDSEALEVAIDPADIAKCERFGQEIYELRKKTHEVRGETKPEDYFGSKVVEVAIEQHFRMTFGYPRLEIDFELRQGRNAGWVVDLDYPNGPKIHAKSSPIKYDWGWSATGQWSNRPDQPVAALVPAGNDALFHARTRDARWNIQGKPWGGDNSTTTKRWFIEGTAISTDDHIVLGHFVPKLRSVQLFFIQPWKYLLEQTLVERTMAQQNGSCADQKVAIYLTNVRYVAGLPVKPEQTVYGRPGRIKE